MSLIEFIKEQKLQELQEASLSRVFQHINADYPVAILTAFRGGKENYQENIRRNKQLASKLQNKGYGYFFVDGFWIENKDTPEEEHVQEDSIFVIGKDVNEDKFKSDIVSFGAEYNQDGVLIRTSAGINIYDKQGKVLTTIGDFKANKIGELYTKLRKNKGTFVFESEREPESIISKFLRKRNELI